MTKQKRLLDLFFALILLIVLFPLMLIVAVLILLFDGRPIFYVSTRSKSVNDIFRILKFRTMKSDSNDFGASGGHKSHRITRFGKILRKTRIDEIPQLINIVKGDMTFVGPRPPLPHYVQKYSNIYSQVLNSRPGITGLASLYYHKHEENLLSKCLTSEQNASVYETRCIPRKAVLDLLYQDNQSICFDLKLMIKTILR